MKIYDAGSIIILVVLFSACIFMAAVSMPFLGKSNPVETIALEVLKEESPLIEKVVEEEINTYEEKM